VLGLVSVEALGAERELVSKSIRIIAFATSDETFHVSACFDQGATPMTPSSTHQPSFKPLPDSTFPVNYDEK
jgi:hypothetical protein